MKKIVCLLLAFSLILVTFSAPVTFADFESITGSTGTAAGTNPSYRSAGAKKASNSAGKLSAAGTNIVNAILWFGYAIALGMVVLIGIKYILGSAEAKSNMKSAIVSWFIGAFIVFMCTTIVGWVLKAANLDAGGGLAEKIINAVG